MIKIRKLKRWRIISGGRVFRLTRKQAHKKDGKGFEYFFLDRQHELGLDEMSIIISSECFIAEVFQGDKISSIPRHRWIRSERE